MSLQVIWTLFNAHPAKFVNILALLFAFPGGWLLHATRRRELRALANLPGQGATAMAVLDAPTARMNRFFYRFGFACLGMALLVSWVSTRL